MDDPVAAGQLVILIFSTTVIVTCMYMIWQRVKGE
jgi:hypothetical protein